MDIKMYKEMIDANYPKYLEGRNPSSHYDPIKELLARGGKRLRPTLCMLSCDAFGGDVKDALPTAIAIEFFHNFTLIHDDIQDKSQLRRGEPTLHIKYGVPIVLNAGDGLYAISYQVLEDNEEILGIKKAWRIFKEMIDMNVLLVEGQAIDLTFKREILKNRRFSGHGNLRFPTEEMSEDTFMELIRKKTGVLFKASARCGAIIADASESDIDSIGNFWENVGIAFQIRDDILNVTGEEKEYGKNIGDDISEGKPTLLLIHCLKNCDAREKKIIMDNISVPYDPDGVKEVIELYRTYRSIEYAEERAEEYMRRSYNILNKISLRDKEEIRSFAEFFIERDK
ncbi:MAG: Geranylgeranyl diphosphate synthase [Candidatus Methanolliviera sp. GoM_asphalt]|nr:MAG: Geranylgeranyl diphosphate synthase [Candidatus Methanolliviera sp. GoM_asphalt]